MACTGTINNLCHSLDQASKGSMAYLALLLQRFPQSLCIACIMVSVLREEGISNALTLRLEGC